ncbi:uncharacterized protein LOC122621592 isoform X1 [Drosophila teissieri]|uniref:uncharacterized protein LOC122621592 isoform X1 n=1 Tax=Drosophila teissieri TaxID=7243 RepID=UPI001CB9F4EF|nr:uncharacterized protein LOC122621592 isoform X1 [Drosophila teissieri]
MGSAVGKLLGLLLCLQCLIELHGVFIRFTNVTCESKDLSMSIVEYCEVTNLSKNKNSISLRYTMLKPMLRNIEVYFQLMTRGSESINTVSNWRPFLHTMTLDLCRFWKNHHNYLARMVFEFIEGHTNVNHTCPYTKENYISIEDVTNTEVSGKIRGVPMPKGFYALFTKWSTENISRVQTNFYFEVLSP